MIEATYNYIFCSFKCNFLSISMFENVLILIYVKDLYAVFLSLNIPDICFIYKSKTGLSENKQVILFHDVTICLYWFWL